jgi:DNA-binding NarL/FixJ family response regulator
VRVVIGEDLFLLRDGLVRLLDAPGFEVVAAVGSAPELLRALTELKPDVGIVDVRLPPTFTDDGLRTRPAASATCSRTGYSATPRSPTRSATSPRAAPSWTPRSSAGS